MPKCTKAHCNKELPSDYIYKSCETCRTQDRLSKQRTRAEAKRKREKDDEPQPRKAPNPVPPSAIQGGEASAASEGPHTPSQLSAGLAEDGRDGPHGPPFLSNSEDNKDSSTHYQDAESLFNALRRVAKQPTICFQGDYTMDADTVVPDKSRVQMTILEIWKVTGYRFTVKDNRKFTSGYKTRLFCSQDEERKKKPRPVPGDNVVHRENVGMKRFHCQSRLSVTCRTENRTGKKTISVRLNHHEKHISYQDVETPAEAIDMIRENIEWSTPNSLVTQVQRSFPNVSAAQVHRVWTKQSEGMWKRRKDQLPSAEELLSEYPNDVDIFAVERTDGVEQLCWGMKRVALSLKDQIVEVGLDATYNTNAKNLELYSIMGEYDNAGFPLSYCLLSTAQAVEIGKRAKALENWAKCVRDQYHLKPQWILTDKDMAEISMAKRVWPQAKHQLCWWHLKRAVRERLSKAKLSTTPYQPQRAHKEFPFIKLTFKPAGRGDPKEYEGGNMGATPDPPPSIDKELERAPGPNAIFLKLPRTQPRPVEHTPLGEIKNTQHVATQAEAPCTLDGAASGLKICIPPLNKVSDHNIESETEETEPDERRTFCPEEYRARVLDMMENHYNSHPLIPGYSAPTPEGIREWAVKQMYEFCENRDLPELWAYLWENWYRPSRWELWARCVSAEIPRLRTTMILESHWRRIKKDFLHHFHKPRVDLLAWIIVAKLAPTYYRKLDILLNPSARFRELSSWRKGFKKDWKAALTTPITLPLNDKYRPDARRWVCTCPHFVRSRFLLCKHLVQSVKPVSPVFFLEVQRYRSSPIWRHPQLVPVDSVDQAEPPLVVDGGDSDPVGCEDHQWAHSGDPGDASSDDDSVVDTRYGPNTTYSNATFDEVLTKHIRNIRDFCDGLDYQRQFRDQRFLNTLEKDGAGFLRLVENCLSVERRRNSTRGANPTTWEAGTSNAMFYRTRPRKDDRDT